MTTQGYHEISDSHMKQELFYESSINVQSKMLEKMFIFLYGEPGKIYIQRYFNLILK